jgi:molybdate transport system substrate-binding protein
MTTAVELKVLAAIPIRAVMEDLDPKFESATGHKLAIKFASLGEVLRLVDESEAADVVIVPQEGIDAIVNAGKAEMDNVTVFARASVGLAVREGMPQCDISSPEGLKRTLLAAKSVTYSNPSWGGVSGAQFARVLDRLGISEVMKAKTVFPERPGGDGLGVLLANGEAEIAAHQIQELIRIPGITILGPLPTELQDAIVFSAGVMNQAKNVAVAKELVAFLRTPEAAAVIKAKGLEPAIS